MENQSEEARKDAEKQQKYVDKKVKAELEAAHRYALRRNFRETGWNKTKVLLTGLFIFAILLFSFKGFLNLINEDRSFSKGFRNGEKFLYLTVLKKSKQCIITGDQYGRAWIIGVDSIIASSFSDSTKLILLTTKSVDAIVGLSMSLNNLDSLTKIKNLIK